MEKEILIVEDFFYLQKALIDWLVQAYPQCAIIAADNQEDALDIVNSNLPSLIIIHLNRPRSDGFDATRRIKAAQPVIPIIMIMDDDSDIHKDFAFSAGADVCLSNNRIQTELLPTINKLLNSGLKMDDGKIRSKLKNDKGGKTMMNNKMYDVFTDQWQKVFKTQFVPVGNGKQNEAFLKFYKDEQENFQAFASAWQDYVRNIKPDGNSLDIGQFWLNYLESSRNFVNAIDSCSQNQHNALFSFYKALTPEIPSKGAAANK